jgi:hypothetical protein
VKLQEIEIKQGSFKNFLGITALCSRAFYQVKHKVKKGFS